MKKKSFIAMLRGCVLLLLLSLCLTVKATAVSYDIWNGVAASSVPYSGHTYTVTTVAQLAYLAQQNDIHNGYSGDTIRIAAHLDLNGYDWMPIGSKARPFAGVFDGQNHLIRGFSRFVGTIGIGLFGHIRHDGKVCNIGISGGQLEANNQRKVGTIAGINNGLISKCWNMAEIHVAGTCVGGLVGENNGTLRDVYNTGLILRASDTIGGLVGMNKGTIEYAYSIGYVHNGNALIGYDQLGCSYVQCYHDRKLYYQAAGSLESGVYSIDNTGSMGSLFLTRSEWFHATNLYPALAGFETTDASILSVSPIWLDTTVNTPPDHANDLTQNFKVSTLNGVVWTCREENGANWIKIVGSNATVHQTCDGADVLLNADLGSERRIVYTHPRRLNDFYPGFFAKNANAYDAWCNPSHFPYNLFTTLRPAGDGWKYGNYHYKVDLDTINPATGDTTFLRNLLPDTDLNGLMNWYNKDTFDAIFAGYYIVRVYSHDEQCAMDWIPAAGGGYAFEVYAEFYSGTIVSGADTVYGVSATVNVSNLTEAHGGHGTIGYTWYVNQNGSQQEIAGQKTKDLVNYTVTGAGLYEFTRGAYDEVCETVPISTRKHGIDTLVLRDTVNTGYITNTPLTVTYCSLADAQKDTIYGSKPSGGNGIYEYQWYIDGSPISGATKQHLALADVPNLTAGTTYTFTRSVKDNTHFTTLKASRNTFTVIISAGFDAGRIENRTLNDYCIMGNTTTNIHIYISSIVDASGDGILVYTWYRAEADGSNPVVVGHDADLDLTFPSSDITIGKTYIYYREVVNTTCGSSPVRSNGQVTQTYIANDHTDSLLIVCSSLLPYVVYYPDPQEGPYVHRFTESEVGVPYTFRDMTTPSDCYPTMTITLDTISAPEIRVDSVAKLCQEEGTITIYYEVLKGCPDSFLIELSPSLSRYFDGKKYITGTMDAKCAGETGFIVLRDVKRIGMGTNYIYVQAGYQKDALGEEVCFSMMHKMDLEVNIGGYIYSKYDKVLFVDNAPDNDERLTFTAYQWYKDGVKQVGQTGQYYQENGQTLSGIYYADLTTIENGTQITYRSCEYSMPRESSSYSPAQDEKEAYITIYNDQVVIVRDNQMFDLLGRAIK